MVHPIAVSLTMLLFACSSAPIERQIAVGNIVRRDEDVAYTIGFGPYGTMRVPKFFQTKLKLKNKHPGWSLDTNHVELMNTDDECYLGNDSDVSKGCVDFDPIHTSDGKLLLGGTDSTSSASADLHILYSSF